MRSTMIMALAGALFALAGCGENGRQAAKSAAEEKSTPVVTVADDDPRYKKATFGGGCFWCMETPFDTIPGVISTISGYSGGTVDNPTYEMVSSGTTGHAEVVQVTYDPTKTSYEHLLLVFWRNIDPTTKDKQFADEGTQYRTAIFYHDEEQRLAAEKSKEWLANSGIFDAPIVTEITNASAFWPAEDYHQNYCVRNPAHYKSYRIGSGREGYLERVWGGK